MLMHPDTAAALDSFTKGYRLGVSQADQDAMQKGAERERRRIRRAQRDAVLHLGHILNGWTGTWDDGRRRLGNIYNAVDAATRAPSKPKKARRR